MKFAQKNLVGTAANPHLFHFHPPAGNLPKIRFPCHSRYSPQFFNGYIGLFFFGGGDIQKDTPLKTHMEPPKMDGEEGSFLFHLFGSMLGFLGKQFIMPIVI